MSTNVTRGHGFLEGFLAKQRIKITERLIPASSRTGRILDIGCGSYPLFLQTTNFSVKYGLDKMVREDQIQHFDSHQIKLINFDSEQQQELPFESDYFDIVTMLAVFEHIEPARLIVLLREIRRILKPGGSYILTTPAIWSDGILRVLAKVRLVSPEEIAEHKDAYSHTKISRLLLEAGFTRGKMNFGYFEVYLNIWATATK